jgi:Tol biopolymer transport system component
MKYSARLVFFLMAGSVCLALLIAQEKTVPRAEVDRIYVDQYGPSRSELMIADADGRNAHKLIPGAELDYNASFSSDSRWVIFTSERHGSADIFRVRADGTGLERLTDSPVYDDQAALSPDDQSVAFVSTRDQGSTDIYILDLKSRKVRNLTNSPGGDFRPSWSPDGKWIVFTSDRGTGFPHAPGRWEHTQAVGIYLIQTDGTGLRKLTTDPATTAGSPKFSADGRQVVFYEMPVRDTYAVRSLASKVDSRIVSVDLATGTRTVHVPGPGLSLNPQFVGPNRIAYLTRSGRNASLAFTTGEKGASGDIVNPAWSPDGKKVVYHAGQLATMHHYSRTPGAKVLNHDPRFELVFGSGFPAVSPDGRVIALSERVPDDDRSSLVLWDTDGTNPRRIYHDQRFVMGLQWSSDGQRIAFGAGGFFDLRTKEPARIMTIRPDGSEARAVTPGVGNAGFPSWSPDGSQIVYRFWTEEGAQGLRIVNTATRAVRTLTTAYDTLPAWSPKGDMIAFSRYAKDERFLYEDFDIYVIRPDGTGLKRLTDSEGNDAHPHWSPDGRYILWSSSRFGFRDEAALTISQPQPYAELFVMNSDGSNQQRLTDNQYEDGTPAWVPPVRLQSH